MTSPCPNCREPMQVRDLPHNYHGTVRVELCFGCAGIWFDHLASAQLAPAGVIDLFKDIKAHERDARRPLAPRLDCPRCREGLAPSVDLGRAGRFTYFRCGRGDGRYTPFLQFLREKQFVRTLTPAEIARVRSEVRQITCSECGAPIDLEHASECTYCHAPVSYLDPDAVARAMQVWSEAETRRQTPPTAERLADVMARMKLPLGAPGTGAVQAEHLLSGLGGGGAPGALDLLDLGFQAISYLFKT